MSNQISRLRKTRIEFVSIAAMTFMISAAVLPQVFFGFPYFNYIDEGHVVNNVTTGLIDDARLNIFYGPTFLNISLFFLLVVGFIGAPFGLGDIFQIFSRTPEFYQHIEPVWILPVMRLVSVGSFALTIFLVSIVVLRQTKSLWLGLIAGATLGSLAWYVDSSVIAMPEMLSVGLLALSIFLAQSIELRFGNSNRNAIFLALALGLLAGTKIHYLAFAPLLAIYFLTKKGEISSRGIKPVALMWRPLSFYALAVAIPLLLQDTPATHAQRIVFMFSYYSSKTSGSPLWEVLLVRLPWVWILTLVILTVLFTMRMVPMWATLSLVSLAVIFIFFSTREFVVDRNLITLPLVLLTSAASANFTKKNVRVRKLIVSSMTLILLIILIGNVSSLQKGGSIIPSEKKDSRLIASELISEENCDLLLASNQTQFLATAETGCDLQYFDQEKGFDDSRSDIWRKATHVIIAPNFDSPDGIVAADLSKLENTGLGCWKTIGDVSGFGPAKRTNFYLREGSDLTILRKSTCKPLDD